MRLHYLPIHVRNWDHAEEMFEGCTPAWDMLLESGSVLQEQIVRLRVDADLGLVAVGLRCELYYDCDCMHWHEGRWLTARELQEARRCTANAETTRLNPVSSASHPDDPVSTTTQRLRCLRTAGHAGGHQWGVGETLGHHRVTQILSETTLTIEGGAGVDHIYTGGQIAIVDGTGQGQIRRIVGYDGRTGQIQINHPWIVEPGPDSVASVSYPVRWK